LHFPRTGIWLGDLTVNGITVPSGKITATFAGVRMPCAIVRSELVAGRVQLRIVGGAGGFSNRARPKHYHRPVIRHVLNDLCRDAGEALSGSADLDILNTSFEAWTTAGIPGGAIIAALCEVAGDAVNWRVLADGTLWIGPESWPESDADYRSLSSDGPNASTEIGTDIPDVWPGQTLNGRHIDYVVHDLDENRTRILYVTEDA
jgi:hypothetical protein